MPTRYSDYREEVDRAFVDLRDRCDVVVVGGLSMGGCLTLELAARPVPNNPNNVLAAF